MDCHRCEFKVGVFETRCKVCGERASRIRLALVSISCLAMGLAFGCIAIYVLKV